MSFFDFLSRREVRDYVILLDCGPSMSGVNQIQAHKVIEELLPTVCHANPQGMNLKLFVDTSFISAGPVKDETSAKKTLATMLDMAKEFHNPSCLAEVLHATLQEHFAGTRRATSVLVVTTGEFKDNVKAALTISNAIHDMKTYFELTISFLQVGFSESGTAFLTSLQEDISSQCHWPIVDVLPLSKLSAGYSGFSDYLTKTTAPTEWHMVKEELPHYDFSQWTSPSRPVNFQRRSSTSTASAISDSLTTENFALVSLSFFASLLRREVKNYQVLLDCSEGMKMADYNVARHILGRTLGTVYDLDKEGISIWVMKGGNTIGTQFITDGEAVDRIFWDNVPEGKTRLSMGLKEALCEHFTEPHMTSRNTSILVIASSPPVDWHPAAGLLVKAAMDTKPAQSLTVSFLNVGTGWDWTKQMATEVNVRANYDFVDSYQVPANADARRASIVLGQDNDIVHHYVEKFLPKSLLPANFEVQPSQEFYSYHFP